MSLSCQPPIDASDVNLLHASTIAKLTALTRLELPNYARCRGNVAPLMQLRLIELLLIDSQPICEAFLVSGAFPALRRLHILETDNPDLNYSGAHGTHLADGEENDELEYLCKLGGAVLSLPCLTEVSGHCPLFTLGMAEDLAGWMKVGYRAQSRPYQNILQCKWTKPIES